MSEAVLSVFVTNLGKYNEGILAGEWLKLPTDTETVQALFSRIGIDGVRYEEFFITDYESTMPGLHRYLGEYESLDELNYLAALVEELDDPSKFEAALEYGEHSGSVQEMINLTQNLDCYELYAGVDSEEALGYYFADELNAIDIPDHIQQYFDYEAYGRDLAIEGGEFVSGGYIDNNGSSFVEYYGGREDIPEEYRVCAFPKEHSILETLKVFRENPPREVDGKTAPALACAER